MLRLRARISGNEQPLETKGVVGVHRASWDIKKGRFAEDCWHYALLVGSPVLTTHPVSRPSDQLWDGGYGKT
ncbi:hypothetical protein Tco_1235203 [Tanacetum coccineum]